MVWYERCAIEIIFNFNDDVQVVFDAYGELKGVKSKGVFTPIRP